MDDRKYYCFCEDNCRFETMTKEQILAAIKQAVEGHEIANVDAGFVTKVIELNSGEPLQFWLGTAAEYNAIAEPQRNVFYIVTNDSKLDAMEESVSEMKEQVDTVNDYLLSVDSSESVVMNAQWDLSHAKNNLWVDVKTAHFCCDVVANGDLTLSAGVQIGVIAKYKPLADCPIVCQVSKSDGISLIPATITKTGSIIVYADGRFPQGTMLRFSGSWLISQ